MVVINGISDITGQLGQVSGLGTQIQNTFGGSGFGGFDHQQNSGRHGATMAGYRRDTASANKSARKDEAAYDMIDRRDQDGTLALNGNLDATTPESLLPRGRRRGYEGGHYEQRPRYSSRFDNYDYGQNYPQNPQPIYSQPVVYAPPVPQPNPINGFLDGGETKRGLANSGILNNPTALADFAADVAKVTGCPVTYVTADGKTMLSMDKLAAALNTYAKTKPIDFSALERGDAQAWQALDAALDVDAGGQQVGSSQSAPSVAPAQPQPTITYPRDEKVEGRIAELLQNESLEKRKKMAEMATAALKELGIKVEGSPIEELSGWITDKKPLLAERMRSGNLADAAAALRQATGELESEATHHRRLRIIKTPDAPAAAACPAPPELLQLTPQDLNKAMLLSGHETTDRVSRMKGGLNRMLNLEGDNKFNNRNDEIDSRFLTELSGLANKNLDQKTIKAIKDGAPFSFSDTFQTLEKNFETNPNGASKSNDVQILKPVTNGAQVVAQQSVTVPTTTSSTLAKDGGAPAPVAQVIVTPTAGVAEPTTYNVAMRANLTPKENARWAALMAAESKEATIGRLFDDVGTEARNTPNNTSFKEAHKNLLNTPENQARVAQTIATQTADNTAALARNKAEKENDVAIEALKTAPAPVKTAPVVAPTEPKAPAVVTPTPPPAAKVEPAKPAPVEAKPVTPPAAVPPVVTPTPAAGGLTRETIIEKAKEMINALPADQKQALIKQIEKAGIAVKNNEEAQGLLKLVEDKFPGSIDKVIKGDMGEAARVFGELEKMIKAAPAAPTQALATNLSTTPQSNNMTAALAAVKGLSPTLSGGLQDVQTVGMLPNEMQNLKTIGGNAGLGM